MKRAYQIVAVFALLLMVAPLSAQDFSGIQGSEPVIDVIHGALDVTSSTRKDIKTIGSVPAVELIEYVTDDEAGPDTDNTNEVKENEEDQVRPENTFLNGDLADYGLGYGDHWIAYPNPTAGELTIEFSDGEHRTVVVINMIGQTMLEMDVQDQSRLSLQIGDFPDGMYFLQIVKGDIREIERIELVR